MKNENIGVSPSGKAADSDSVIPRVQILPPQPSLLNKIDDRPKKPDLSGFFACLASRIFSVKP